MQTAKIKDIPAFCQKAGRFSCGWIYSHRSRIHQIKRGGLGVAIDILFRVLLVTVPDMKDFYQALMSDVDRNDALKLISHKDPIRITEDVLLGAMSMQR